MNSGSLLVLLGCMILGCAFGLLYTYQEYKTLIETIAIIFSFTTSFLAIYQFLKSRGE